MKIQPELKPYSSQALALAPTKAKRDMLKTAVTKALAGAGSKAECARADSFATVLGSLRNRLVSSG